MSAPAVIEKALEEGRDRLSLVESLELALSYELPVAKYVKVTGEEELEEAFSRLKPPLVLKVSSPDITHKTDVGGVKLNINSLDELRRAYRDVMARVAEKAPNARIDCVVVQEMVKGDYEVIIGGMRDPQFGPVIAFGLGGLLVEVFKDVAFDLAPLSEEEAYTLMSKVKGFILLIPNWS